jgi:hypothetical protein
MSDENKKEESSQPETFFLPPLKMVLAFFDKESRQREKKLALSKVEGQKDTQEERTLEKNVEKLIEKLSEKEE